MRTRRVVAMAVGTLAAMAAPWGVTAQAATGTGTTTSSPTEPATELVIESQPGTSLQGLTGVLQPPTNGITAVSNSNGANVTFNAATGKGWSVDGTLTAPTGQALTAGTTYTLDGSNTLANGAIYLGRTDSGGCSSIQMGSFTVEQIAFDGSGALSQFEAMFTDYCGTSMFGGPITGLIRYNATGPVPDGAPTGKPLAAPAGTVAPLTFRRGQQVVTAQAGAQDGTVFGTLPSTTDPTVGETSWSPLGTRLFSAGSDGLVAANRDGSGASEVTSVAGLYYSPRDEDPSVSADGTTVVFVREYSPGGATPMDLMTVRTDATRAPKKISLTGTEQCDNIHTPNFAPDGSIIYECDSVPGTKPATYHVSNGSVPTLFMADASHAVYSPDGTRIAFVRDDSAGRPQIFTVGADGKTGLTQVTHDEIGAGKPAWSPDGKYLAYAEAAFPAIIEIPAAGGVPVGSVLNADDPSWAPPPAVGHVQREWGQDRLGTAIAASQADFANHGDLSDKRRSQAGAVVLARGDNFADALGGSALAVDRNAPLLVTPTAGLDPAVRDEIHRVLAPGGTVYLLGGTGALSPAVAQALTGYTVVRLAGADRYATAVAIAETVDPHPAGLIIATGDNYPDALAAGATGFPVVLTDGAVMPSATASYLDALNPIPAVGGTQLITVGGPGDAALVNGYLHGQMPDWPVQISRIALKGDTRYATSLLVAEEFFVSNADVALATGVSWPDALSGGAMIGHRGGPLLLVDPNGIDADTLDYLHGQSASLSTLHLLGGLGALPAAIGQEAAQGFEDPGQVQYGELTPGGALPFAVSAQHAAKLVAPGSAAPGAAGVPGSPDAVEARVQPTVVGKNR